MEHSAIILSTIIKLPIVIKIFVLSIFEWPFYTGLLYLNLAQLAVTFISNKNNKNKFKTIEFVSTLKKNS